MPWWYSEQESACQWRGHGFGLGSGKIPYVKEQLRPCVTATVRMLRGPRVTTTEPVSHNYRGPCTLELELHNERSHPSEKEAHAPWVE